jgi:hypothetical protein
MADVRANAAASEQQEDALRPDGLRPGSNSINVQSAPALIILKLCCHQQCLALLVWQSLKGAVNDRGHAVD